MTGDRLRYYAAKIRSARAAGNLALRLRRRAYRAVYNPVKDLSDYYFALNAEDRRTRLDPGFQDHRGNGNHKPDAGMLGRIVRAYKLARRESAQAPAHFAVRGLWAEWISVNYGDLVSALTTENLESLARLLENFNRERFSTGTGYGYDDCRRYGSPFLGRRSIVAQWCHYRNLLHAVGGDAESTYFPLVGNPAGVRRRAGVVPIETLRHAYNATQIEGLLRGVPEAVIVEIGGGFGGQAFQTLLRTPASRYLVFDIPEVAAVCSYLALAAFPGRRVRLFGEGPVSASAGEDFEIGVFPHFTIGGLEDRSVDLVFNESSFSEMDGDCSRAYLAIAERICRRYFLHSNHDTPIEFRHGGAVSSNCIASDLVPSSAFKRIYKMPRVFGRSEDKLFRHYSFLYERIA